MFQEALEIMGLADEKERAANAGDHYFGVESENSKAAKRAFTEEQSRVLLCDEGFDTLQDINIAQIETLSEFYNVLFGNIVSQEFLAGFLITGTIDLARPLSGGWGEESLGFKDQGHPELWSVRSSPKGRMCQPLQTGEIRSVAVMVRPGLTSPKATVAIMRLWLLAGAESYSQNLQHSRSSYGAHGAQMTGIHLFGHHGQRLLEDRKFTPGRDGFHVVLGSFSNLTIEEDPAEERRIIHVTPSVDANYVLAAHIAGFDFSDDPPMRHGIESYDHAAWLKKKISMQELFTQKLQKRYNDGFNDLSDLSFRFVFGAESVAECLSYAGFLDLLSDPFCNGALPDDLHLPCGLPLLMVMAVRVACEPKRCGILEGTPDDKYASNEMKILIDAVHEPLLSKTADGREDATYAIDLVLRQTMKEFNDEKNVTAEMAERTRLMFKTLSMLYRTGRPRI